MNYTVTREFPNSRIDKIEERTRAALKERGFGVLTEIDVQATLKQKIGVDMDSYRILGACNPKMAHQAIQIEPRIGAMLPCNVILRQIGDAVEVSAVDPVASMTAVENEDLRSVAGQVRDLLTEVVEAI